jgi:hypothetical protein
LTGERGLVKRNRALPFDERGRYAPERRAHTPRPVQRRRSPVRIRRCPATAMPHSGTSQVDRPAPNERQPSEEGRFGRPRAAGPPPPQKRRFLYERTND